MALPWITSMVSSTTVLMVAAPVALLWGICIALSPKKISLKGKHVVVVGGSSGIGLSIAKLAAVEGAKVTVIARDSAKLEDARSTLKEISTVPQGPKVFTVSVDVTKSSAARGAAELAAGILGPIDVLVLSQGIPMPGTFAETSEEVMHKVMNTNFWGSVNMVKGALGYMRSSPLRGREPRAICFVSSIVGQVGMYGYAHYAASKFALRGLAESLVHELLPDNIRVSLLYPPDTDTPCLAEENKTKPEVTKLLSDSGTLVKPELVARKALEGIKRGDFHISANFDGWMLKILAAGFSPEPRLSMAIFQILLMGPLRLVGLVYQSVWAGIILSWHKKNKKKTQ